MELLEAMKTRKSIRAFRAEAVSQEVIQRILKAARWSPSWGNTQPWELVVVKGAKVKDLVGELAVAFEQKTTANPDVAMPGTFPDIHKERYMACTAGLMGKMGVARDDMAGRIAFTVKMARDFGPPVIIYLLFNADLAEPYNMFDLGAITHAICLAAHDLGLGTCIMAALAFYPHLIRRHLGLTQAHKIVVGIALGYPDLDHPANSFRSEREPLEQFVRWIG